jgi:hypothetical protein
LPHSHPLPHPAPAASRVDEKRRWDFDDKHHFCVMFCELTKSFCLTSSPANACHPPQTNLQQPRPTAKSLRIHGNRGEASYGDG